MRTTMLLLVSLATFARTAEGKECGKTVTRVEHKDQKKMHLPPSKKTDATSLLLHIQQQENKIVVEAQKDDHYTSVTLRKNNHDWVEFPYGNDTIHITGTQKSLRKETREDRDENKPLNRAEP